jgi:hypothetical protein
MEIILHRAFCFDVVQKPKMNRQNRSPGHGLLSLTYETDPKQIEAVLQGREGDALVDLHPCVERGKGGVAIGGGFGRRADGGDVVSAQVYACASRGVP